MRGNTCWNYRPFTRLIDMDIRQKPLFKSKDNGKTWRYVTDIYPSFWPKLFVHRGKLYLFSATQDYGDMVIGHSDDEGETWTAPTHIITGCGPSEMGPHKAPMPVIEHNGRLYTAID